MWKRGRSNGVSVHGENIQHKLSTDNLFLKEKTNSSQPVTFSFQLKLVN